MTVQQIFQVVEIKTIQTVVIGTYQITVLKIFLTIGLKKLIIITFPWIILEE